MPSYDGDITLSVGLDTDDVINKAEQTKKDIEEIFNKSKGVDVSPAFKSQLNTLDKLKTKYNELSGQITELQNKQIPTKNYVETKKRLDELEKKRDSLKARGEKFLALGGKEDSKTFKSIQYDLNTVRANLKAARIDLIDLVKEGQAFTLGKDTKQYQDLINQLNQVNNAAEISKQRIAELGEVDFGPLPSMLDTVKQKLSEFSAFFGQIVASLARGAVAIGKGAIAFAKFGASLPIKAMKQAVSFLTAIVKKAAQLGKNALTSGIKKLGNAISGIGKHSRGTNDSLKSALRMFIRYGLGVRSLFALINKLRRAVTEGFENLAQAHEPFNIAISNIKTAMAGLKNNFSAAFAPLIEFVEPALTRFIYLVSEAVSKLGMLIAALTGKEFVKAVPVYQDYAKSVDKTSKSSEKARKEMEKENQKAKELKKTLAGFDDINILNEDKQETKEEEPDENVPEAMFQTAPIEGAFANLADKLKEMWKNADFSQLGRILGEKLRDALNRIPWDKIKETLRKIAHSIATFLNGFLETPGLFTAIGNTLAQALNSAFEFLNEFVHTFHWESLGQAIKDGLLAFIAGIDWPLIYDTMATAGAGIASALQTALNNQEIWTGIFTTISNGLNSVLLLLDTFLQGIDWASLGANIGNGLNDGVEAFDWNLLGQTLIDLVNAAFDLWYNFVTTFDFYKFGTHIGETFSQAVKGIDWTTGGASVAATINALYDALTGFVEGTDWKAVGKAVTDTIAGFFGEFDWKGVGQFISSCIIGLADTLTGMVQNENIKWGEVAGNILNAIGDFLSGFDWKEIAESVATAIGLAFGAIASVGGTLLKKMGEVGKAIIDGGLQGIIDGLANIVNWIKEHVFDPFIEAFKSVFVIGSPSEEMKPLGGYIVDGLLQGIIDGLVSIVSWLKEHVADPIISGIKSLFGLDGEESVLVSIGSGLIDGLKTGLSNAVGSMKDWIGEHITGPISGFFKNLFGLDGDESVLVSVGSNLIDGLKTGLSSQMDNMKTWVDNHVTGPICGFFKDLFGIASPSKVFKDYGGYLIEGLQEGMDEEVDSITENLEDTEGEMRGVFENADEWSNAGADLMVDGLKTGLANNEDQVEKLMGDLEMSMRDAFKKYLVDWQKNGANLIRQLVLGIKSIEKDAKLKVENLSDDLLTILEDQKTEFYEVGASYITNMNRGVDFNVPNLVNTMRNLSQKLYDIFYVFDWAQIGYDLTAGIYRGIVANWQWLNDTVSNLAQSMYNTARNALGIASPSKVFRDGIGRMIPAGMAVGIMANEDEAIQATDDMIKDIVEASVKRDPTITLGAELDTTTDVLSTMLDQYSSIIVENFSNLISMLEKLGSLPSIVQGKIVPYSNSFASNQDSTAMADINTKLDAILNERISREDIIDIVQRYLNFSFRIGDEDIARHANAGNLKLDRRFNAIRGMT